MADQLEKDRAKVHEEWMDASTAAAWRKWHDKSASFWRELDDALLAASRLGAGQRVLDLASGTGNPALAIAERIAPTGHVVVTDLAPQMLEIARDNAARAHLANLSFEIVDAHALPYRDSSFDRVTCRLGVMFFWDCGRALGEIRRVLKPGGLACFVAWGPADQNEAMRTALAPFNKRKPLPTPSPTTPQPFRFGAPGSLSAELRAAGFSGVTEETRTVRSAWPGPPAEAWLRLYEVAAPMRPYFDSFEPDVRDQAIGEVVAGYEKYFDGSEVVTHAPIVIAVATK